MWSERKPVADEEGIAGLVKEGTKVRLNCVHSVRGSAQSFEAESRCQKVVGEERGEFKTNDRTENKSILKAVVNAPNEQ